MKKLTKLFFFILLFHLLVVSVSAQEKIQEFKSEIAINKDGTIDVSETINYDFGSQYRHGIFRDIYYIKTNKDGKKFLLTKKIFHSK